MFAQSAYQDDPRIMAYDCDSTTLNINIPEARKIYTRSISYTIEYYLVTNTKSNHNTCNNVDESLKYDCGKVNQSKMRLYCVII